MPQSVLKISLDYGRNEICCRYRAQVRNINLDSVTCGRGMYGVQIIALDKGVRVNDINVRQLPLHKVKGNYKAVRLATSISTIYMSMTLWP